MSFFRKFRKLRKNRHKEQQQISFNLLDVASKTDKISHTPGLIDSLHNDHALLGQQFEDIHDLFKNGQYLQLKNELKSFRVNLQMHTMTENVKLYTYLEQVLAEDPSSSKLMVQFRREMNIIASAVRRFTKQYESSTFTPQDCQQFEHDYQEVGAILEQRLEKEESELYPLYQQSPDQSAAS